MEIIKVAGLGIITVFFCVLLKQQQKEYALLASAAFGVLVMGMVLSRSSEVIQTMAQLFDRTGLKIEYFDILLKAIGISYLCYFAQNIAKDAGEHAIAAQIELAGKLILLVLSLPILLSLVDLLVKVIGNG